MEQTLVILKPDAVQRRLCGRILQRFEDKGLKVAAMKMIRVEQKLAEEHYGEHKDKPFFRELVDFITACPVIVMALVGPQAISIVRKTMGATFGFEAAPGTIRGDFSISKQNNLVHGSASPEEAKREINLFFDPEEIYAYEIADESWVD